MTFTGNYFIWDMMRNFFISEGKSEQALDSIPPENVSQKSQISVFVPFFVQEAMCFHNPVQNFCYQEQDSL